MGRRVTRGEVWLAHIGHRNRPVVVLTRSEVLDVRELVTIAEVTTSIRGLSVEVPIDEDELALDQPSVINCDGLHTVRQSSLTSRIGEVSDDTLRRICSALSHALSCWAPRDS